MQNQTCSSPLDGPPVTKDYLAHYCFEAPQRIRGWLVLALLSLLSLAVAAWQLQSGEALLSALSPAATLGLLVAGLWQWRGARREISMDKYYERLNIANQWWKSSPSVRKIMTGFTRDSEDPDMTMYVCLEIDNLEYVIEKYRLGYVDDEQACRGLKAFQVRCLSSSEFRTIARRRVHVGDYTPRTVKVVCRVCDEVDNLVEHHRATHFASWGSADSQTSVHTVAAAIRVTPCYLPPPLPFGRRASDRASGAASSMAGGEAVSAPGAGPEQREMQSESPPPA